MSIPVFSREGLIAWLETQDPATEYKYTDNDECLLCRYFRARGIPLNDYRPLSFDEWTDRDGVDHPLPEILDNISVDGVSTYGAALIRAKELATP